MADSTGCAVVFITDFSGEQAPVESDFDSTVFVRPYFFAGGSDDPSSLTSERAQELLQLRRERGPAK